MKLCESLENNISEHPDYFLSHSETYKLKIEGTETEKVENEAVY